MARTSRVQIDPTASVHPSVILEGNITIGAYTRIGPGTVIVGDVTIGDHTLIQCNTVIRGTNRIGSWVHIYDMVCIEGGRPGGRVGGVTSEEPDRSIISDWCWVNHGSTMHGAQLAEGATLGLNVALDYNTRVGRDALLADGSACRVNTVIPDGCLANGVPAVVVKEGITDDDRREIMGLVPREWLRYAGERQEETLRLRRSI